MLIVICGDILQAVEAMLVVVMTDENGGSYGRRGHIASSGAGNASSAHCRGGEIGVCGGGWGHTASRNASIVHSNGWCRITKGNRDNASSGQPRRTTRRAERSIRGITISGGWRGGETSVGSGLFGHTASGNRSDACGDGWGRTANSGGCNASGGRLVGDDGSWGGNGTGAGGGDSRGSNKNNCNGWGGTGVVVVGELVEMMEATRVVDVVNSGDNLEGGSANTGGIGGRGESGASSECGNWGSSGNNFDGRVGTGSGVVGELAELMEATTIVDVVNTGDNVKVETVKVAVLIEGT
ncbi:hypothetical protein AgCh_004919 [Apium graveolens]